MSRSANIAILALGAGFIAVQSQRRTRRKSLQSSSSEDRTRISAASADEPKVHVTHGLALKRDGIDIVSWDDWMDYAPEKFVEAVQMGYGTAEEILAFVMQGVFPALRWPPQAESPYRPAWDRLVIRVDQALPRVAANGGPGLRII